MKTEILDPALRAHLQIPLCVRWCSNIRLCCCGLCGLSDFFHVIVSSYLQWLQSGRESGETHGVTGLRNGTTIASLYYCLQRKQLILLTIRTAQSTTHEAALTCEGGAFGRAAASHGADGWGCFIFSRGGHCRPGLGSRRLLATVSTQYSLSFWDMNVFTQSHCGGTPPPQVPTMLNIVCVAFGGSPNATPTDSKGTLRMPIPKLLSFSINAVTQPPWIEWEPVMVSFLLAVPGASYFPATTVSHTEVHIWLRCLFVLLTPHVSLTSERHFWSRLPAGSSVTPPWDLLPVCYQYLDVIVPLRSITACLVHLLYICWCCHERLTHQVTVDFYKIINNLSVYDDLFDKNVNTQKSYLV